MSRVKTSLVRLMPVLLLSLVMLALCIFIYTEVIHEEEQDCWDVLSNASLSMAQTIENRFEGNMVLLDRVADALHIEAIPAHDESVLDYLNKIQHTTMFSRIDILYPDGRLLCQDGSTITAQRRLSYEELAAAAPLLTPRTTDAQSGREVLYYFTPVHSPDRVEGLLVGTIDCETLRRQFTLNIYGGKAQVYLVDRNDGNFIINNWSNEFGNIERMEKRQTLPGYEGTTFTHSVSNGTAGRIAYYSNADGKKAYMYMMPVKDFPWQLCIAVSEEIVFEKVLRLRQMLSATGATIFVMLIFYLTWNVHVIFKAVDNEEKARRAEMERAGNEAKSRFLSSISHDIRTPLNGILGMLDLIRRRNYDPAVLKSSLHKIEVSAQYLSALANDVLDLNEIEGSRIILASERMDLMELEKDLESLIAPRASENGIQLHFNFSDIQHPMVIASSVHLQRLFINLMTNAIKYNNPGGDVWIRASELEQDQSSSLYRFTVQDNGIGMTEEFQQDMFKAFEQEHGGARTIHQGHGLGLSIVKRLVDAMQGTIEVRSRKDEGSSFTVTLPLTHAAPEADDSSPAAAMQHTDISGMNILLAEDNELNMEIAMCLLSDAGATVIPVADGQAAVEAFKSADLFSIDAILMDVMMPRLDGLDATRAIRAMEREDAACIPIIAMTASTFVEDMRRCQEAGMNHHMSKPLDIKALLQVLTLERARYHADRKEAE